MAKILLVDDDADLLSGQKAFLSKKGFTVETAGNIADGLAKAAQFAPDLVVADLMMEHYDSGFVFCKKVRELPGLSEVPILMQTAAPRKIGFTFDTTTAKNRDWMKVDEVLTKPVPLEDLLGKVEQLLSRKGKNA